MRAMVRRTSRTRRGFSSWLVAAWKRRLNCSRFRSPSCCCNWSSLCCLRSSIAGMLLFLLDHGLTEAGDDLGPDRQLLACALHVTRERAAGRVDLASSDPLRLHGLKAIGAEVEFRPTLGIAVDAALE